MKKRICGGLMGALAAAMFLSGCQSTETSISPPAQPMERPAAESSTTDKVNPEVPQQQAAVDHVVIETEYGDLYYPEQWNEYLITYQTMNSESLSISFSAKIRETEYPLFQVTIGDSEDTTVGEVTDRSGITREAHLQVFELEESDDLSKEEQQRVYAMQEDLNYVIDHLA